MQFIIDHISPPCSKNNNSYNTTNPSEHKFSNEQPLNLVQSVLTETAEEWALRVEKEANAKLKEVAELRARLKAESEIGSLRTREAENYKAKAKRLRVEAERLLKEATESEQIANAYIKGDYDETLKTAETTKNAVVSVVIGETQTQTKPKFEKTEKQRERVIVKRKDLSEVIRKRTHFKTTIKGQVKKAMTEDGRTIHADGKTYDTLNKWLEASVRAITGDNKTKKSVFEVVFYYNDDAKVWRKLGTDYTAETERLN
jgi:hypothetical protein